MQLSGALFIGQDRQSVGPFFQAIDPSNGTNLPGDFSNATAAHVDTACCLADAAFDIFSSIPLEKRAEFLDTIAENILGLGDELIARAHQESGLPIARLTGERGRTVNQLKLFAAEVRDGAWMGLRIDPAMPERAPLPRSDLRLRRTGLGPVAVFGASNFPLAFSVAGGDTASALAAGCPVVVKAHGAHPGTSELVATAISEAVASCGLPNGTFSMLFGSGNEVGQALVAHPAIKAVGFTGSQGGGLALMRTAAARPVPIPVYAEMSAVNPVIILPGALEDNPAELAKAYVGSLSLGAGQFCTNPGLVFAIDSPALDVFVEAATKAVAATPAQTMLTPGIHTAYQAGIGKLKTIQGVKSIAVGSNGDAACAASAAFFETDTQTLEKEKQITEEIFGASSILIRCPDIETMQQALASLDGQLTASVHMNESDHPLVQRLLPSLEKIAGRIIANGWPTGVEVCHAMVHGGPYPATSDVRTTSVGTLAIDRFLRPICYQDFPDGLLPEPLKGEGAPGVPKRIDGKWRM